MMFKAVEDGTVLAYRILWSALINFLKEHWLFAIGALFVVLVIATIKSIFGRWGMLGSLIYNFLYFGVLFIVGLIWGPNVFTNGLFAPVCAVVLYPTCYLITGYILDSTRAKHRFVR